LERLTQLLFSAFPGSTVYRHADLLHVAHDVLNHKVDVILLEAEMTKANNLDLMRKLRRQKPGLPVFVTSETEVLRTEAEASGAHGFFVLPDSEQLLVEAIRLAIHKEPTS
jgi:DNA-binding NarL/FixJ family response regulator